MAESRGGRSIDSASSIGRVGVGAASEIAEERAQSNGQDHMGFSICESMLTFEGIYDDPSSLRNDVLLFKSHSVRMAMIEAVCGPEQIH